MEAGMDVLAAVLSSDLVREAVAEPRAVPRALREHMAEIVARDIILGKGNEAGDHGQSARRLGPLYYVYLAVRQTDEWAGLRQISGRSPAMALLCARAALTALFEAFDELAGLEPGGELSQAQVAFERLVQEAMSLWGRQPGECDLSAGSLARFEEADGAARLMSDLAHEKYVPRISTFLEEAGRGIDAVELISLLHPGRAWDRGMADLYREHLGDIRRYADIAARSAGLRRLLETIGRQGPDEAPGRGTVAARSRSEVHSVITSNDINYLLPSELVKLQDPTLKYLFMARWTEGKLLTYQLSGKARPGPEKYKRKGPIVALVDTSGSMSGSPGRLAKAVVLAVAKEALKGGRDMRAILFASTGQSRTIDLSGEGKMAGEFFGFLRQRFGGGTDFNTALGAGLAALQDARYGGADLLFITDGLSRVTDDALLGEWQRFRVDHGTRIFTIIVGNDSAGGLERISDATFVIEDGKGRLAGTMKMTSI
jgi:uncharacterized protein with von Willebrand factor type A (vWA) domain